MYEWFIFLRGLCIGLVFSLILISVLRFRRHYLARTLVFFATGIVGYLVAPLLFGKSPLFFLATAIADTTPLAFMLFTQALFDDDTRPRRSSLLAGATYLTLGYAGGYLPHLTGGEGGFYANLWLVSRVLVAGILTYSFYVIVRLWREDLVEPRRRMRLAVTVIICGYILAIVVVESLMEGAAVPLWVEVANSAGIALSTVFFASSLVLMNPLEAQHAGETETPQASPVAVADQREIDRIVGAMESDHVYRDMELTIRSLGATLSIPEHRLRQHINRVLDYRNFSDFLNRYRIDEATARLRDPGSARTPVLTIAMDAGYRSMTTFNKAFKARHGQTPVEFRQQQSPIS